MPYPDTFEGFSISSHERWSDFKRTEVRHIMFSCEQEGHTDLALYLAYHHPLPLDCCDFFQLIPKTFGDNDVDIVVECCGVCGSAYLCPIILTRSHLRAPILFSSATPSIPMTYYSNSIRPNRRSPHHHRRLGPKKAPSMRRPRNYRQSHQNWSQSHALQSRRPRRRRCSDQSMPRMQSLQER